MSEKSSGGIFHQKALDKLHSPEQLDKLFITTTPEGWLALATVLLLIFSGIVWSIFGSITSKVSGVGMIVDSAGIAQITHNVSGRIVETKILAGDKVTKGQVIAILEHPELEQEISRLNAELNATTARTETAVKVVQLNVLQEKLRRNSQIISPYDGIISEENLEVGAFVQAGAVLANVRQDQGADDMFAILYVPVLEGKKISAGMMAQIAPGAVEAAEYGTLVGRVRAVTDYPALSENMNAWIGNKEMINWILQKTGGAAVKVTIELIKDDSTPTGYLWSSIRGAPITITPGTAFTGTIVVKRDAPIVKAFNKLGQWLRSD